MTRPYARAALLLSALSLAACHATDDRVESRLRDELPRVIGPADEYDVDVQGVERDASSADAVDVVGYRVQPRHGGPVIDRLHIELRDVRYDRENKRLERAGSARATVWVTAEDLDDYLERNDAIGDATVTLQAPDSVFLRVRPDLAGIRIPGATLEIVGTLEGRGPLVEFDVADVRAVGFDLGDAGARQITRLINPVVDLSELPLRLDVGSVRVEGRTIRLDAEGDATPLP